MTAAAPANPVPVSVLGSGVLSLPFFPALEVGTAVLFDTVATVALLKAVVRVALVVVGGLAVLAESKSRSKTRSGRSVAKELRVSLLLQDSQQSLL